MSKRLSRGFTLIELLVVIAIIGILSSVVLASLNTARGKGADAAVKSNLNNIRAQAELVYDTNGDYSGVCADGNVDKGVKAAASAAGLSPTFSRDAISSASIASCNDTSAGWAVRVPLKSNSALGFCVDNAGTATTTVNQLTATSDVVCD